MMKAIIISAGLLLAFTAVTAQTGGNSPIQEISTVFTGFEPRLAEVNKIQETPVIQDTFPTIKDTAYSLLLRSHPTVYVPDTIQAVRLKGEPLKKLHRLFIRGGFGNYTSVLGEIRFNSLRAKENGYFFNYLHNSSNGSISRVGNTQLSDNVLEAGYQHRFKQLALGVEATYKRNGLHYYGYDPDLYPGIHEDSTRQRYTMATGMFWLGSRHRTDSIRMNYQVKTQFYHVSDLYGTHENVFKLRANLNRFTDLFAHEFLGGNLEFDYNSLVRQEPHDSLRNGWITTLNPYFKMGGSFWKLQVGAAFIFAGADSGFFAVYPRVNGKLNIFKKYIILHGSLSGNYHRNTFNELRGLNPFIMSYVPLKNANTPLDVQAGVKGAFSDLVSYDLGVHYFITHNAPFFVDDTLFANRPGFNVLYDELHTLRFYAGMEFQYGEKLQIGLHGKFNTIKTEHQAAPWYRPRIDLSLTGRYNLGNKILATAEIYFLALQKAPVWDSDSLGNPILRAENIDPLVDINLSATYRLNRNFSFFLRMNNMAAFRYNRFNRYPGFGFMVMGGFSISI